MHIEKCKFFLHLNGFTRSHLIEESIDIVIPAGGCGMARHYSEGEEYLMISTLEAFSLSNNTVAVRRNISAARKNVLPEQFP